ncbi:MAG: redoxin domain-containing protein, partial [Actinobacteria bacterium]|nr:redoxin domain-containing protein [Actinomycetota bacterium]
MTKAPELIGDTWFGTTNPRLGIADFKGRFLLLDFWTLCCVNCHHVLAELRPVEEKFKDVLTVVGVHSPKFEYEKLPESVAAAIARHEVHHPVLNDPNMTTWQSYGVRAWPTLVLVDPKGDIIATYSGEGHAHAIEALLEKLVPSYEAGGYLVRGAGLYKAPAPSSLALKQPGKIVAVPAEYRDLLSGAELLISNSGGHNLVGLTSVNLVDPVITIGAGVRGSKDGNYEAACFAEPYGAVFLEKELASKVGAHLLVADTANHLIRAINLETKSVFTIAGTGEQWMQADATTGPALEVKLSTPWDIEVFEGELLIAMAGEHRIWKYDFQNKALGIFAGTTNEGLVDGKLTKAWFAQPSALVQSKITPSKVWLIDAETSALRCIENGKITSQIGKGLFDFGHVDGPADEALLQHPVGIIELPDGNLLIADTYNSAIRKYSPATNSVATIARDLSEPSDIELVETASGVKLAIVEAAANRITLLPIEAEALVQGNAMRTARPA